MSLSQNHNSQRLLAQTFQISDGGILPNLSGEVGGGSSDGFQQTVRDDYLPTVVNFVFAAIISVAIVMVLWGGIMFILSGGEEDKRTKGRDTIIWSLVGIGVAMAAYGIVNAVLSINFFS